MASDEYFMSYWIGTAAVSNTFFGWKNRFCVPNDLSALGSASKVYDYASFRDEAATIGDKCLIPAMSDTEMGLIVSEMFLA